jgi:hypothetical protein
MQQRIKLKMLRTVPTRNWNICFDLFDTVVGRENTFKPTMGNENLQEISNDNGVRIVSFATSKNLSQKYNVPTSQHP